MFLVKTPLVLHLIMMIFSFTMGYLYIVNSVEQLTTSVEQVMTSVESITDFTINNPEPLPTPKSARVLSEDKLPKAPEHISKFLVVIIFGIVIVHVILRVSRGGG